VLARTTFPGQRLLRVLVTLPLVLPPVVGGVALLLAFSRVGLVGRYLDYWFGLTIPFTPLAVIMAETFVAMPFLIITVEGALRSADQGYEEAAATLGATRMTVFRRVTVPLIAPSLGAGAVLYWRQTPTRRSRSAWCCCWCPSWSWSRCAITGCGAARSHDGQGQRRPRRRCRDQAR